MMQGIQKTIKNFRRWWKGETREYEAGRRTRLNADWKSRPTGDNYEQYLSLRVVRARSRNAFRNDGYFKRYAKIIDTNVIGHTGFQLQCTATLPDGKTPDIPLNKKVENAFWDWSHKENCTMSQDMNFLDCLHAWGKGLPREGEVLVQIIRGADNPYGFALKLWNVDYLDELYNEELSNGNRVIMSVELDANDRRVAFYFTTPTYNYWIKGRPQIARQRVPASEILFVGLKDEKDADATRHMPWVAAALQNGRDLHEYKHGVINSAKVASHVMGFFMEKEPSEDEIKGPSVDAVKQCEPTPHIDSAPASFYEIGAGWDMKEWDPKQPTQNHSEFYKTQVMDLAVSLDLYYYMLSGDLASVNLSSMRIGRQDIIDMWKSLQTFFTEHLCRPIFHAWLREAVLHGALDITMEQMRRVMNPTWGARGWEYMDPYKDVQTDIAKLRAGLTSRSKIAAERGEDLGDLLDTIKADEELMEMKDLEFDLSDGKAATASTSETDTADTKKDAPTDTTGDETDDDPAAERSKNLAFTNGNGRH